MGRGSAEEGEIVILETKRLLFREMIPEDYDSLNAKSLVISAFSNPHVSFLRFSCLLFLRADIIALTSRNGFHF